MDLCRGVGGMAPKPGAVGVTIPRNSGDFPFLPICVYRRVFRDGPGATSYYVCGCSGGFPIGTVGEEALELPVSPADGSAP